MRTYRIVILLVAATSCTEQKKFNKDTVVNACLGDFTKKNDQEKIFTTMQLANICDCIADKMITKYKSFKEADNDPSGAEAMGRDCALEVMQKK